MKIAFVDNLAVGGGLSRFSYMLCKSLLEADKTIFIDYYTHYENIRRTPELNSIEGNFSLKVLDTTLPPSLYQKAVKKIRLTLGLKKDNKDRVLHEIEQRYENHSPMPNDLLNSSEIIIGNDVWIGFNVTILKGVTIGQGAVIGANTLITKDVPEGAVVIGPEQKILKYI